MLEQSWLRVRVLIFNDTCKLRRNLNKLNHIVKNYSDLPHLKMPGFPCILVFTFIISSNILPSEAQYRYQVRAENSWNRLWLDFFSITRLTGTMEDEDKMSSRVRLLRWSRMQSMLMKRILCLWLWEVSSLWRHWVSDRSFAGIMTHDNIIVLFRCSDSSRWWLWHNRR